jgi:hypothetical protein
MDTRLSDKGARDFKKGQEAMEKTSKIGGFDSFTNMLKGIVNASPATDIVGAFVDYVLGKLFSEIDWKTLVDIMDDLLDVVDDLGPAFKALGKGLKALMGGFKAYFGWLLKANDDLAKESLKHSDSQYTLIAAMEIHGKFLDWLGKEYGKMFEHLGKSYGKMFDDMGKWISQNTTLGALLSDNTGAMEDFNDQMKALGEWLEENTTLGQILSDDGGGGGGGSSGGSPSAGALKKVLQGAW